MGFWAAVFASLLGVWQSVPYLYADFYSIIKKLSPEARARATQGDEHAVSAGAAVHHARRRCRSRSSGGRCSIIVTYTIVGSLFVPFLAATLLYLNNRVRWTAPVPHNHWTTNALLVVILALFLAVGAQEVINAL